MEKCYFNSCILNDNTYLAKYKKALQKQGKEEKKNELFKKINAKDNIIKSFHLVSNSSKYIFCLVHYNHLQDLLKIKDEIESNPFNISKDSLIKLNNMLRYNTEIKKIIYEIKFKDSNIINILLTNLTKSDKDNKLYILSILNHFLKDNISSANDNNEKKLDNEIFNIFFKDINDLKLMIYDLNHKKENSLINDEKLFRDTLLYVLYLNNIECLFNNWNNSKEPIELKKTIDLVQNTSDIICQIVSAHNSISNKKLCNELFYNIIGFLNTYILCNIKNNDLIAFLINFFVKINQHIYGYLNSYKNEDYFKNSIKNYITLLNSLLEQMIKTSLNDIDTQELNLFLKNTEKFNKDKKYELLFYKNDDMIQKLKVKVKLIENNKNNPKVVIDEL